MNEKQVYFLVSELSRLEKEINAGGNVSELFHKRTRKEAIRKILQDITDSIVINSWVNQNSWSLFEI